MWEDFPGVIGLIWLDKRCFDFAGRFASQPLGSLKMTAEREALGRQISNSHGHDDVAVLVVFAVGWTKLPGGLGVF